MSLDQFIDRFSAVPAVEESGLLGEIVSVPGALDAFIEQFNGLTEKYMFYDGAVELRYSVDEHRYYKVGPLGELYPLDGVTNTIDIIDKSHALVPWAAKKVVEKMLRLMPTHLYVDPETNIATVRVDDLDIELFQKLLLEAKTAPRDILEDAGDIGHMAHTWLQYYIEAVIAKDLEQQAYKLAHLPEEPRACKCVEAALKWMRAHNVRWVCTERKIYSRKYEYAGTADGLALVDSCGDKTCKGCRGEEFKDRLSVIDWKSSNALRIGYLYQTACYMQAFIEEFGGTEPLSNESEEAIRQAFLAAGDQLHRWILRLGKEDGEFDPWHLTADDFQEDFEAFLDCLRLTRSVRLTEDRMRQQKSTFKAAVKVLKDAEKLAEKEKNRAERAAAMEIQKAETQARRKAKAEAAKVARAALRAGGDLTDVPLEEYTAPEDQPDGYRDFIPVEPEPPKAKILPIETVTGSQPYKP